MEGTKRTMVVLPVLFLLGSLFLCSQGQSDSSAVDALREAALNWDRALVCDTWDCNCTFNRQRSCCCAANEMFQVEDYTFKRIHGLFKDLGHLYMRVKALTDGTKIAFKASIHPRIGTPIQIGGNKIQCFGPFNSDVPLPFAEVSLNEGNGYNPSLGIFTAPCAGVYVFSFTIYSNVTENQLLYHKVTLWKNGEPVVSVWENNREDGEDSATQVVVLDMKPGDQVYLVLMSGRKICKHLEYSIFTGYILYPHHDVIYHDEDM